MGHRGWRRGARYGCRLDGSIWCDEVSSESSDPIGNCARWERAGCARVEGEDTWPRREDIVGGCETRTGEDVEFGRVV